MVVSTSGASDVTSTRLDTDPYFISFRNPKHARLIGTFLDFVYRHDHNLYIQLMEEVRLEVESEVEELAYNFRSGRLADLGFPERDEALGSLVPADARDRGTRPDQARRRRGDASARQARAPERVR